MSSLICKSGKECLFIQFLDLNTQEHGRYIPCTNVLGDKDIVEIHNFRPGYVFKVLNTRDAEIWLGFGYVEDTSSLKDFFSAEEFDSRTFVWMNEEDPGCWLKL